MSVTVEPPHSFLGNLDQYPLELLLDGTSHYCNKTKLYVRLHYLHDLHKQMVDFVEIMSGTATTVVQAVPGGTFYLAKAQDAISPKFYPQLD